MSGPSAVKETPIERREQLVEYMASGAREPGLWKIGTEHEKFGFRLDDLRPPTYDGPRGIGALLQGLTRFGWTPISESVDGSENVIALARGDGSITLEPAGQLELSGGQVDTIHQTCKEVTTHLKEVKTVADELQLGFLGMGFQPKWKRDGDAVDAERPLQDHAALYAPGRFARSRHDDAHLHGAGQSRLRRRSGHGEEISRLACAATDRDCAVRRLAVHRRQAERLSKLPLAYLDRHRSRSHRHARLRVRGRLRLRTLRRLPARCADVLQLPRRQVHRSRRQIVQGFPCRQA